jgi:hypothetical protein
MTRPRPQPPVEVAVVDEAELAHRHQWLTRWLQLTPAGEGVQLEHRGSLSQRVAHIEAELDRVGKRDAAERFFANLEAGSQRTREHIARLKQQGYGP